MNERDARTTPSAKACKSRLTPPQREGHFPRATPVLGLGGISLCQIRDTSVKYFCKRSFMPPVNCQGKRLFPPCFPAESGLQMRAPVELKLTRAQTDRRDLVSP